MAYIPTEPVTELEIAIRDKLFEVEELLLQLPLYDADGFTSMSITKQFVTCCQYLGQYPDTRTSIDICYKRDTERFLPSATKEQIDEVIKMERKKAAHEAATS